MTDGHKRVLVVDDEAGVRESVRMVLRDPYECIPVATAAEALEVLQGEGAAVVLLDIVMPGVDGLQLLEEVRARWPQLPVVMLTATKTVKTAVAAIKLGAADYLTKPFDIDELRIVLDKATEKAELVREVEHLRHEVGKRYQIDNIIGRSPKMQEVFRNILIAAPMRTTMLITGESGTGKELIAKAIHYHSPRARKPLVTLNCAAIQDTLLESELFGHEKGSFTDAFQRKLGQFELAHEGTLFLDEIGETTPSTQAKLLRVLEHGEFLRVGGQKPITVDVRLVAATNRRLEEAVQSGSFRSDLYYRLNVVQVTLPPLRERHDDLLLLIRHFMTSKSREMGRPEKVLTPDAIDILTRYPWPGNVRELENLIERVLVLAEDHTIGVEDLPEHIRRGDQPPGDLREEALSGRKSLEAALAEFEREIVTEALQRTDFNQTRAAALLSTTRRILKYSMDKLGISAPDAE